MKKVLILAYDFPPYVSVGGLRPYNWYKYMHEFGVYPIVITRQWENKYGNYLDYIAPSETKETLIEKTEHGTIIRTPYSPNYANRLMQKYGDSKYRILRKSISAYYEFAQYLFLIGTKSSLYFSARQYIKNNPVDLIIATGDPFVLFKYASKLSKTFGVPWIADYRDPWSQKLSIQNNFILKAWYSYFEKKIVATSCLISTVDKFCINNISKLLQNKEIIIIPNGYDPHALLESKDIKQQSEYLSIGFVGTIYEWDPINSFLKVISNFVRDKKDAKLKVYFYGINISEKLNITLTSNFPELLKYVSIHPKMPNNVLLQKLANMNLMLLFNYYFFTGTKIYDYIGIKRTILFCYSNDEEAQKLKSLYYPYEEIEGKTINFQEELLKKTNSGYVIKDANHLYTMLENFYTEFNNNGFIQCNTINEENYSRKHQVKQLTEIIKKVSNSQNKKN